jgi:hypothetical protein
MNNEEKAHDLGVTERCSRFKNNKETWWLNQKEVNDELKTQPKKFKAKKWGPDF